MHVLICYDSMERPTWIGFSRDASRPDRDVGAPWSRCECVLHDLSRSGAMAASHVLRRLHDLPHGKVGRDYTPIPVLVDGVQYPSIYAAAKAIGCPRQTLSRALLEGYTCAGRTVCRVSGGRDRTDCIDNPEHAARATLNLNRARLARQENE